MIYCFILALIPVISAGNKAIKQSKKENVSMYKLNVKRSISGNYEAIVKRRYFNKLWLIVGRKECRTKKECKDFYRIIAAY